MEYRVDEAGNVVLTVFDNVKPETLQEAVVAITHSHKPLVRRTRAELIAVLGQLYEISGANEATLIEQYYAQAGNLKEAIDYALRIREERDAYYRMLVENGMALQMAEARAERAERLLEEVSGHLFVALADRGNLQSLEESNGAVIEGTAVEVRDSNLSALEAPRGVGNRVAGVLRRVAGMVGIPDTFFGNNNS